MEIICGFCLDGKQSDSHVVSFHPFTLIQEQANICVFLISLVHTVYSPSISPLALQPAKGLVFPLDPRAELPNLWLEKLPPQGGSPLM